MNDQPSVPKVSQPDMWEYIDGEWIAGGTEYEPAAVVAERNEDGRWAWWALGQMGDEDTVEAAKAKAKSIADKLLGLEASP